MWMFGDLALDVEAGAFGRARGVFKGLVVELGILDDGVFIGGEGSLMAFQTLRKGDWWEVHFWSQWRWSGWNSLSVP